MTASKQGGSTTAVVGTSDAVFGLIQTLADNKYWLGRRYAEWCTAAPTLESAVAAAAMAQDEIGHARSLYPLFRQLTGNEVEPEDREVFHSLTVLSSPFRGWFDFVATNFIVDTAFSVLFEAAKDSSCDDLRHRARRIAGEEYVHWLHAKGWVKRLALESNATQQALERALGRQWVEARMWYGPPNDESMEDLRQQGVIALHPDELRGELDHRLLSVLGEVGIETPDVTLDWKQWDPIRRHAM